MERGVTVHRRDKCYHGYTLFCETYNPGSGTGRIYLVAMEGNPVHSWQVETALQSYCRLLPDGNLIYPTRDRSRIEEAGLRELDPESNAVWHYHCRADHDCQVLGNGNLLIHTITDHMVPELGPGLKRNPYMLEIDRDRELLWKWHGEEHLRELRQLLTAEGWAHVQHRIEGEFSFDWAHNNTLQVIPPNATHERERRGSSSPFKPGNIVFSYRSLDVIGVIDRESGEIVWAWGPGALDGQHKPHVLDSGNILIFDNGTLRGYSRVIEVNPITERIEWQYTGSPKEDFLSRYISGAQRLPNGNTLICEGGKAHLFEVTPEGEVVWDFTNHLHDEASLGTIYRCLRYSPEYVDPLLQRVGS